MRVPCLATFGSVTAWSSTMAVPPNMVIRLDRSIQLASTTMPRLPVSLTLVSRSSSASRIQVPPVKASTGSGVTPV